MSIWTMAREVWLLPEPVRTAQTAMTGFVDLTWVSLGPRREKEAPAAFTRALMLMTCW